MPENRKTAMYLLVAAMALLVAWEPWNRVTSASNVPSEAGKKLFAEFTDPLSAKSLEIVQFDEDTATLRPFKVAQVNGVWSIPSHNNYPADAREHMAQAATALLDLDILGLASSSPGDQELYGVVAPDPAKLKQGSVGVGTRVTLKDGKDKTLADLIVGKDVKDQPGLRYVRRADRDQICRVSIKTDKLSTKFEDWIEKDLLKLNAFDVTEVDLNDYSVETGVTEQGSVALNLNPRSRAKLAFDNAKSTWNLVDLVEFDKGQPVAVKLEENEELNSEKLNSLKTALDDLQIVDVERKPKGLSQDLRASDEFVKDNDARMSLMQRGFFPARVKEQIEVFSSEGEATCTTKDGVRYVLRFGQLAGGEEPKDDKPAEGKEKKNPALNRYLFVMAEFDESQIPKPQMDAVPGEAADGDQKPATEPPAEPKAGDAPAESKPAEDKAPADAKSTEEAKPAEDAKPAEEAKPADEKVPEQKTAADEADDASKAAADEKKADEKPAAEEKKEEQKPVVDPKPATPEEEKALAIRKENKRKQTEYDDAVKKGQDRVKELNDRFADWYFIISDDVYKKIHLGRADIVKKKEADGDKEKLDGVGGLKDFEQGLQPR